MDSVNESMTIFPDPGAESEVASLLLELADSPRDVKTTLDPGLGFIVPSWLFEAFIGVWDDHNGGHPVSKDGGDVVPAAEVVSEPQEVIETPARRKPGRPRKES